MASTKLRAWSTKGHMPLFRQTDERQTNNPWLYFNWKTKDDPRLERAMKSTHAQTALTGVRDDGQPSIVLLDDAGSPNRPSSQALLWQPLRTPRANAMQRVGITRPGDFVGTLDRPNDMVQHRQKSNDKDHRKHPAI